MARKNTCRIHEFPTGAHLSMGLSAQVKPAQEWLRLSKLAYRLIFAQRGSAASQS